MTLLTLLQDYSAPSARSVPTGPVEITDDFDQPRGEWSNYTTWSLEHNIALLKMAHVDIRSFVPDQPSAYVNMLFMDRLTMFALDGDGTNELSLYTHDTTPPAHVIVINNEGWSYGEVGPQSDRNNWNGIKFTCPAGQVTTSQSVITANG